jgi:hypothetical protein
MGIKELIADKIRIVRFFHNKLNGTFTYTCYDSGSGAYRVEEDKLWINIVQLTRHPQEEFEPHWIAVALNDDCEQIEEKSWLESSIEDDKK